MIEYDISGVKLEKYEWDSSCTILFVQNFGVINFVQNFKKYMLFRRLLLLDNINFIGLIRLLHQAIKFVKFEFDIQNIIFILYLIIKN